MEELNKDSIESILYYTAYYTKLLDSDWQCATDYLNELYDSDLLNVLIDKIYSIIDNTDNYTLVSNTVIDKNEKSYRIIYKFCPKIVNDSFIIKKSCGIVKYDKNFTNFGKIYNNIKNITFDYSSYLLIIII